MTDLLIFIIFISIFFGGLLLACWYGRKTKRFRWSEYIALFFIPLLFLVWLTFKYGIAILIVFFGSAIFGTLMELILGWAYHKTLSSKLWTYKRLLITPQGYTSWLSIPFWGLAGVILFLIAKSLGA